jgi:hypothetical protein
MFRSWWSIPVVIIDAPSDTGVPWWAALLFGLSCIGLGIMLVVWPALLSILVASTLIAAGILALPVASRAGWDAWRHRPRRIRVRVAR